MIGPRFSGLLKTPTQSTGMLRYTANLNFSSVMNFFPAA